MYFHKPLDRCATCRHAKWLDEKCPHCYRRIGDSFVSKLDGLRRQFRNDLTRREDVEIFDRLMDGESPNLIKANMGTGFCIRARKMKKAWEYFKEKNV